MAHANENFAHLQAGYLFPEVARRINAWSERNPGEKVLRLSIGNTTEAIPPSIAQAMKDKIDALSDRDTYTGYGDEQGDIRLREALRNHYRNEYGVDLPADAFFVSDGAKSDAANIQSIFSSKSIAAVQDPAYPVYVDSNVAGGHTGVYDKASDGYSGIIYMKSDESNGFVASPPDTHADIIYLCFPNNPTGAVATRDQLRAFVDYAHREKSVIIFDAAYCDYIQSGGIPHSIYEIEGAEDCAIEINSFSKNAGFTGVRLGWTIVPHTLITQDDDKSLLHRFWNRRQTTFFNGACNIAQAGGIAALTEQGRKECMELVSYYKDNAAIIKEAAQSIGLTCFGGVDSPYVWTKCPEGLSSWDFFSLLLEKAHVAVTPGSGFGPAGEGFVRISAYGHREDVEEATASLKENL